MIKEFIPKHSYYVYSLCEMTVGKNGEQKLKPIGTTFCYHVDGYFFTCAHIIDISKKYTIASLGEIYDFQKINNTDPIYNYRNVNIVQYDNQKDVALLKIADGSPCYPDPQNPINIDNPFSINVGTSVYYIGYPFVNFNIHNKSVSTCIISSKVILDNGVKQYQIDSMVHEGNSGGPLIDAETNRIIGIITGTFDPLDRSGPRIMIGNRFQKEGTTISYAVPIEYAIELLKTEGIYE